MKIFTHYSHRDTPASVFVNPAESVRPVLFDGEAFSSSLCVRVWPWDPPAVGVGQDPASPPPLLLLETAL